MLLQVRRLGGLLQIMLLMIAWATGGTAMSAELLMFEEQGCPWCRRWNAEIGPIYPLTEEGRFAPLRRVDISDPLPSGIRLKANPHFTPTFVLVEHGLELGRIEGYPGEDFFWGFLGRMIEPLRKKGDEKNETD